MIILFLFKKWAISILNKKQINNKADFSAVQTNIKSTREALEHLKITRIDKVSENLLYTFKL